MSQDPPLPMPRFSKAALEAARARRQEAIASADETPDLQVFVVRSDGPGHGFAWEIRRFGALVQVRGATSHPTAADARDAGQAELARSGVVTPLTIRDEPG